MGHWVRTERPAAPGLQVPPSSPCSQGRSHPLRGTPADSPGAAPLLALGLSPHQAPEAQAPGPVPHPTAATHSRASSVMMMRMGRRFMPPTQLLLHMKLYRMVVNSVPTYTGEVGEGCGASTQAPPH